MTTTDAPATLKRIEAIDLMFQQNKRQQTGQLMYNQKQL